MIDRGLGSLLAARDSGTALAAFTTYTLESTVAVCQAAESLGAPVILQASTGCFADVGRSQLLRLMVVAAEECAVPVGVHLDHSTDLAELQAVLDLGATSVMIDGSALPFADNIHLTREAVSLARSAGAWIEAELGAVQGDEDRSVAVDGAAEYTDPDAAATFVRETGVDALAIAVGNVHGISPGSPPPLSVTRVREIAAVTPVPLVLHGASGVPPGTLVDVVRQGVAKVNINTELRRAHLEVLRQVPEGDDIRVVRGAAVRAVRAVAEAHIRRLQGQPS